MKKCPLQQIIRNYLSKVTEYLIIAIHHHEQMKSNQLISIHFQNHQKKKKGIQVEIEMNQVTVVRT